MKRLAIISTNSGQYSETFIQAHIENLPFDIVLYTEGYLPTRISFDKGISSKTLNTGIWRRKLGPSQLLSNSLKKNKIDAVFAEYGPSGVEVMDICMELNIPLIVHFHGFDAYRDDVLSTYGLKYQQLFEYSKAIIAVSKDMCNQLTKLGCDEQKLHHVPCSVDTTFFQSENTEKIEGRFVACGRFVPKKGVLNTLKAFKLAHEKHPFARLSMIGDGQLLAECMQYVDREKLQDFVRFLGVLDRNAILDVFQRSSAFVQHSLKAEDNDSEGTPVSILEASSCELPIIATKHAGIPEAVIDEQTGLLVDEGDIEGMADAMIELLENYEKGRALGKEGRRRMIANYHSEDNTNTLRKLINQVL